MNPGSFIIAAEGAPNSRLGTAWRVVSDTVMGGVSEGALDTDCVEGRACLRLTGEVSLENNGGFVQASLDLAEAGTLDASGFAGIELDVRGNGERYNVHLRTADTRIVWQSYRAGIFAGPEWRTVRLPFTDFHPHRIEVPLDTSRLRRIGLVAIGRGFHADLCFSHLALYSDDDAP